MATFRAETTGGLDTTHPLASTVAFAILPNEGSDNVLTELLRNDTLDFSTDGLTWNADGSVSASTASDDLNLAWSNTHSIVLKDYVSGLAFSKSFILLADVFIGASSGSPRNTFIALDTTTANKSQAYILADNYSDGLQMAARIDFSTPKGTDNDPYTESVGVRTLAVIVWDSVASTFRFIDSTAGYDSTQAETGTETSNDWAGVKIGTGDNLDKLYAAYMLERDGQFTAEEIDSIIADPYQIFRTAEDAVNDYGLTCASTEFVTIPATPAMTGDTATGVIGTLEIEFVKKATGDIMLYSNSANSAGIQYTEAGGVRVFLGGGSYFNFDSVKSPASVNDSVAIKFTMDGTQGTAEASVNGAGFVTLHSRSANAFISSYDRIMSASHPDCQLIRAEFRHNTTDDKRYYDFNRTQGTVVPELLNGQNGTLVGFPTESGYVRELDGIDGVLVGTTEVDILPKPARGPTIFEATLMFKGSETVLFGADTNANTTRYRCYLSASGKVKVRIRGSEDTSGNIEYDIDTGVIVPDDGAFHTLKIIQQFTVDCPCDVTLDTNPKVTANLGVNMYDVSWSRINNFVLFADRFHTYAVVGNSSSNTTKFKRIKFNSDVWDFTQTAAHTVPSTTGAASITLTGVNPVYRPEASGEILGYKFNGTVRGEINPEITPMNNPTMEIEIDFITDNNGAALFLKDAGSATTYWQINNNVFRAHYKSSGGSYNTFVIPFTILPNTRYTAKVVKRSQTEHEFYINGDSIGTSTVSTGLTADGWSYMGWQGSQTLISMKIRNAENGTLLHDWDFTSGDVDTFRDKVGTAHATITSTKTSGWMPIVEKQVFTESDYADAELFANNQRGLHAESHPVYLITTQQDIGTGSINTYLGDYPNGVTIKGAAAPFVGNFDDANVAKLSGSIAIVKNRELGLRFENMILDGTTGGISASQSVGFDALRCGITDLSNSPKISAVVGKAYNIKSCTIDAKSSVSKQAVKITGGELNIADSTIIHAGDSGLNPTIEWDGGGAIEVVNSLVYNTGTTPTFSSGITGYNNFTNNTDNSGTATVIADFTGAFVNG